MHRRQFPIAIGALISLSAASQPHARAPVVGLPCEGCEAVFEGLPSVLTSRAVIAPLTEAGERLLLTGVVSDALGKPRSGVVVYAYHTNGKGIYPLDDRLRGMASHRHGVLRGWAITDANGVYAFDTIRPAAYPGTDIPQHVHMHVLEVGCATYYIDDVVFTDDPLLTPEQRRRIGRNRGGSGVATPVKRGAQWTVKRDIKLGESIPGYAACV